MITIPGKEEIREIKNRRKKNIDAVGREMERVLNVIRDTEIVKNEIEGRRITFYISIDEWYASLSITTSNYTIEEVIEGFLPSLRSKFNCNWVMEVRPNEVRLSCSSRSKSKLKFVDLYINISEQERRTCQVIKIKDDVELPSYEQYIERAKRHIVEYAINCID